MSDVADRAGEESEVLEAAKMQRLRDQADKLNIPSGVTECIEWNCGVDITARVKAVPSATRCVECQELKDRR